MKNKSIKRRRKAKKNKKTIPKLLELLRNMKIRISPPPTGTVFKSIRDYNRRNNKKIANEEFDE